MGLLLTHLPHIIPALVGVGFLIRFAVNARRMPPADLSDEDLAARQSEHRSRRATRAGSG
jgi:hypothetical protein